MPSVADLTDIQLVVLFRDEENQDAFAELLKRHDPSVDSHVNRLAKHVPLLDTEQLKQDAYLKAARSIHAYDPARLFEAWLHTIVSNLFYDAARMARKRSVGMPSDGTAGYSLTYGPSAQQAAASDSHVMQRQETPDGLAMFDETATFLQEAMKHLSPEVAAVLYEYFHNDLSCAQIAEKLGIPRGTVKTRYRRGLQLLRSKLAA